jgi:hypothetical protein
MTPSEQCKQAGLKSLAELSQISNTSTRTLINWHRHNITRFTVLLAGAVVIKAASACPPLSVGLERGFDTEK